MIYSLIALLACGPKKIQPTEEVQPPPTSRTHTKRPNPLEKKPFVAPKLAQTELGNQIPVFVQSNMEVPLVRVWITFDAGGWSDPNDQIGLAQVTMDMLDEGSKDLSAAELSARLRNLGSTLSVQSTPDGSTLQIQTLKQNLAPTLDLLKTVLQSPNFSEEIWNRKQVQYQQNLAQKNNDAKQISRSVWNKLLFADEYVGRLQTNQHLEAINTESMQSWYNQFIRPTNSRIWVGGATTTEEVQPLLESRFGSWTTEINTPIPKPTKEQTRKDPTRSFVYLVDKPGATQSVIRIGHGIGNENAPETTALNVANQAIGGMFTARINQLLREEKGWTYGAWTWLSHNYHPGTFNMSSSVVTEHTASSIREVIRVLRSSKSDAPLTQVEIDRAKGDLLGTFPLRFEQASFAINSQLRIMRYSLPSDWITNYEQRIGSIDLQQAQQAWNEHIDPEVVYILVVGDRKAIEPSLLALGYPIINIDTYGKKTTPE
jgi:predicted Zn-dependent peptidase